MELNTEPFPGSVAVITIGIVDNVPLLLYGLKEILNELPGIEVTLQACDGKDLLQQLQQGHPPPAILLLDISMPGMNGLETAQRLRKHYPLIKAIAFTSVPQDLGEEKMLRAGCYGYLLKGASLQEMEQMIREVHSQKLMVRDSEEELQFSSAEVDRMLLHCLGYEQQAYSEHLEQKLEKLGQQQHSIVRWLGKLLSVLSKFTGRRRRKYLFLKDGYRWVRIAIADIVLIKGDDDYVRVRLKEDVLSNHKWRMYRVTLKELEEKLSGTELLRVNTSCIVNVSHIDFVKKKRMIWIGGEDIPLSAKYAASFYDRLR